jgi:DnaK suppressor protein
MDPDRARELLAAERARLEELIRLAQTDELSDLSDDDRDEHLGDAELDAGLLERYQEDLAAVERAEQRLEADSYGRSVLSGEPIPDSRLEAFPAAELTAEEAARSEG